jgi:hypothetical protein
LCFTTFLRSKKPKGFFLSKMVMLVQGSADRQYRLPSRDQAHSDVGGGASIETPENLNSECQRRSKPLGCSIRWASPTATCWDGAAGGLQGRSPLRSAAWQPSGVSGVSQVRIWCEPGVSLLQGLVGLPGQAAALTPLFCVKLPPRGRSLVGGLRGVHR